MALYESELCRLTPEQYLPYAGNVSDSSYAWSVSLNLAIWLRTESSCSQTLSLYIHYQDSRGKQTLLIDRLLHDTEPEVLFSNLVKVPIKGPIKDVVLSLKYQDPAFAYEIDEVFVKVIDAPPDPRLSKTA